MAMRARNPLREILSGRNPRAQDPADAADIGGLPAHAPSR
jgi:hypothetical protein